MHFPFFFEKMRRQQISDYLLAPNKKREKRFRFRKQIQLEISYSLYLSEFKEKKMIKSICMRFCWAALDSIFKSNLLHKLSKLKGDGFIPSAIRLIENYLTNSYHG